MFNFKLRYTMSTRCLRFTHSLLLLLLSIKSEKVNLNKQKQQLERCPKDKDIRTSLHWTQKWLLNPTCNPDLECLGVKIPRCTSTLLRHDTRFWLRTFGKGLIYMCPPLDKGPFIKSANANTKANAFFCPGLSCV